MSVWQIVDHLIQQNGFWFFASGLVTLATVIVKKLPPGGGKKDRQ